MCGAGRGGGTPAAFALIPRPAFLVSVGVYRLTIQHAWWVAQVACNLCGKAARDNHLETAFLLLGRDYGTSSK